MTHARDRPELYAATCRGQPPLWSCPLPRVQAYGRNRRGTVDDGQQLRLRLGSSSTGWPLVAGGTARRTGAAQGDRRRRAAAGCDGLAPTWANSPWTDTYTSLRDFTLGPASLHLDLSVGAWAADGSLAIFFFVAGPELKRELVAGDLRDPRRAALPIAAAVGGMAVPALLFVMVNRNTGGGALQGWAIPTGTDIAFALAVLAVISSHLPVALRTFLLTLAVIDDLFAITIIALFFTSDLAVTPLSPALFAVLVQRRVRSWWLLLPLAGAAWALAHASGVHATVAGVLLGFAVPVVRSQQAGGPYAGPGVAEHFEHRFRPISSGDAMPVFAFFSAGVAVGGLTGLGQALRDPIAVGIVLGKVIGILSATYLVSRFTHADLNEDLGWLDVLGLALLAGIGFTVSLLIEELAFGAGGERDEHVKVAVLTGSLLAAALATTVLTVRKHPLPPAAPARDPGQRRRRRPRRLPTRRAHVSTAGPGNLSLAAGPPTRPRARSVRQLPVAAREWAGRDR